MGVLKDSAALWFNGLHFALIGAERSCNKDLRGVQRLVAGRVQTRLRCTMAQTSDLLKMQQGGHQSVENFLIALKRKGNWYMQPRTRLKGWLSTASNIQ